MNRQVNTPLGVSDMCKFYMVVVDGSGSPAVRHPSQTQAITEAKRLAKLTGRMTYVLESTRKIEPRVITVQAEPYVSSM